jgi:pilus assembly protein CpaB
MNRDRMLLGLGGALLVAFLASMYVYHLLQRAQTNVKPTGHIQVVVAAAPLQVGQMLAPTDLALLDWPEALQPQGSFQHKEDCIGRAATVPLVANEVVLDQELAKRGEGAGLPVSIPAGMRAVSVGVDDVVAVAGFVTPGTVVDVLATGTVPGGEGQGDSVTRTILEHAKVLAVGQQLTTENGKPVSAPVVTILVNPEDGEKLTLAASTGRIHLALRNVVDAADVNPPPIYGYNVFVGGARPVAAKVSHVVVATKAAPKATPPPPPWAVQVIRGDKVENQSFPR